MKARPALFLLLLALPSLACQPSAEGPASTESKGAPASIAEPPGASYEGKAFTFNEIGNGVYHAVGTGNLSVGCNASIIVNDEDVLIVDSHISPAAAWALVEELKSLTDKPVRYVVNTHFHFDHSHGNQIFGPDVEIIGHEFTREKIVAGDSKSGRAYDMFIGAIPDQIEELEAERTRAVDATDNDRIAETERALAIQRNFKEATDAVVPTPPNTTLSRRMTLIRGGREIQLLFFGRGHTGGDVVVYLPQERVVATGDLLTAGISYMGDGYLSEWADTLEEVKKLDFDVVLPGHGDAFREKEKIDYFQAYIRDLLSKITAAHEAGKSIEEAAATIDMTNHREHYPALTEPGVNPHAVARVYGLLEGSEE